MQTDILPTCTAPKRPVSRLGAVLKVRRVGRETTHRIWTLRANSSISQVSLFALPPFSDIAAGSCGRHHTDNRGHICHELHTFYGRPVQPTLKIEPIDCDSRQKRNGRKQNTRAYPQDIHQKNTAALHWTPLGILENSLRCLAECKITVGSIIIVVRHISHARTRSITIVADRF